MKNEPAQNLEEIEGLQPCRGHDAADTLAGLRHYPLAAAIRLHQLPAARKRDQAACDP
jgi:hypothetical protein